ncbi:Uncharacterised protein [Paenibacillus polymyxa]|uniref:Uncharacterized protein n=2 Tax=Paenibacillus polymyxa TaxID=1406 RepID=A0A378XV48_PAEPO|nr:hypothetical protein [Paenibacillus polymyxa]SPY17047.1 Uncharacterised protein [Paenibacillus polymyxa]SUA68601.1 Uncharacterised protein [Paenibacillus polymyxa]
MRIMNEKINKHLTAERAMQIAENYKEKYNLSGTIDGTKERTVKFYTQFDDSNLPVWLVMVSIIPTVFQADDEYTIVISDAEEQVKYLIDPNGHYYAPHTKKDGLTDEEFNRLWNEDSEDN